MDEYRISIELEGFARDDGHVRLHVLLQELQAMATTIRQADIAASGGRPRNAVRVIDLQHSSPAVLTFDLVPLNPEFDTRPYVINTLKRVKNIATEGGDIAGLPRRLLTAVQQLVAPAGRKFLRGRINIAGESAPLNAEMAAAIAAALSPDEVEEGVVEGRLEAINLHDGRNEFRIYPVVGARSILCHFPDDLKERAKAAIEGFVEIRGTLRYKANAPFPYAVDVSDIDIMPAEDELPTLDDLRGMAPDATGGIPSEDFIKEVRRGWGQ